MKGSIKRILKVVRFDPSIPDSETKTSTTMAITQRASFATDAGEESAEFHVPCSPPPRCLKLKKTMKRISARLSFTSKVDGEDEIVHLNFDVKEETEQDPELFELIQHKPWEPEERANYDDELVYWYAKNKPSSFRVKYDFAKGTTAFPLNRIISLGASLRTVEAVVFAYPPALVYRHHVNKTSPLHSACNFPSNFQVGVIEFLLDVGIDSVKETNRHAFLPIHNACCASVPSPIGLEAIQILVEAYPGSVLQTNKLGDTPLQAAKRNEHSLPDVISYLEEMQEEQQKLQEEEQ